MGYVRTAAPPADRIRDAEKQAQWQGERTKMVYSFPTNEKLRAKYTEVRAERGLADATEFWPQNQPEMDEGAVVVLPT